jgi:hypothetical protein
MEGALPASCANMFYSIDLRVQPLLHPPVGHQHRPAHASVTETMRVRDSVCNPRQIALGRVCS